MQGAVNLASWLSHIAAVHPREIELGLDRVRLVARAMGLDPTPGQRLPVVFIIAGTNGKGSTAAALEAILLASGLRAGCYLSPHIERFNERFRINGADCDDARICAALAAVEQARQSVSLSYFEFATLAALKIFAGSRLDALILEVGLGGRLDAVNLIDADVMLITNIDLDHQYWLGDTREAIGAEKAGILRPGKPLVYGGTQPTGSIIERAAELRAPVYRYGEDYGADAGADGWRWWGRGGRGPLRIDGLKPPRVSLAAMAPALQAAHVSPLAVTREGIRSAQGQAALPGRQELRCCAASGMPVLLDVAHNPAAARMLAGEIFRLRRESVFSGKPAVVLAMLADKDIEGFATALGGQADVWYIAEIDDSRAMSVAEQRRRLKACLPGAAIFTADSVPEAWRAARECGAPEVVVTGSFRTVAAVRPETGALSR